MINYSNIARDCGVDSKTVKEYYQILVDTLLGRFVLPFKPRQARQVISHAPKFYLFDVGVAIDFWRTKSGLEVDFVLGGGEVAIEVKGTSRVDGADLRSLKAFVEEFSPRQAFVVSKEKISRVVGNIKILPWQIFLRDLWAGAVIR